MAKQKTKVGCLTVEQATAIAKRACKTVRDFDYEDMVQECLLELLRHRDKVTGKAKAYGYCRMRVRQYWDSINRQIKDRGVTWRELEATDYDGEEGNLISLNTLAPDEEGNLTELANLIPDSYELQRQVEIITFLKGLPPRIKRLAQHKLNGERLGMHAKQELAEYAKEIF
jgi:DNA-directed RNA polymerase specialized sigma24 family protein